MKRGAVGGLVAVAIVACADVIGPPSNAIPLAIPDIYAVWWAEVEACADVSRPMSSIAFYEVPGVESFRANNGPAAGAYYPDERRIVIAGAWALYGPLVRHEMLHAIVKRTGHSREYFLHRCGNVVGCPAQGCQDEAGAFTWPAGIATLAPDSLIVETHLVPANPAVGTFSNQFALVIVARNPHDYAVQVTLAGPPHDMRGFGFGLYELPVGTGSGAFLADPIFDDDARYFRANESKRAVYDFSLALSAGSGTFGPGNYQITGHYGSSTASPLTFTIAVTP